MAAYVYTDQVMLVFSSPFHSDLFRDFSLFLELFKFASEVESRTQGSRPRTQNKSEAKSKDSPSEDRHSQGQGQECSGPRPRTKDTNASVLFWRSPNIFASDLGLQNNLSGDLQKKTV